MDDENQNYSTYKVVGVFFIILIVLLVIIGIILLLLPMKTVQQFGPCTEQSECAPGLVCSMVSPTGKCLGGLGFACSQNSDCAAQYMCATGICAPLLTTTQQGDLILQTTLNVPIITPTPVNLPVNLPINLPINLPHIPRDFTSFMGGGGGGNREIGNNTFRNFSPLNIGKKKLYMNI
jgi:hypothetical protein